MPTLALCVQQLVTKQHQRVRHTVQQVLPAVAQEHLSDATRNLVTDLIEQGCHGSARRVQVRS